MNKTEQFLDLENIPWLTFSLNLENIDWGGHLVQLKDYVLQRIL